MHPGLTHSPLLDFLCSNGKNVQHLDHNGRDRVRHSFIWRHFNVCVQTSEKCFYALEHLKKCVLVRPNILSSLRIICITMVRTKVSRRAHTERRTANPIKMTFAGESTCQVNERPNLGLSSCSEVCIPSRHLLQVSRRRREERSLLGRATSHCCIETD